MKKLITLVLGSLIILTACGSHQESKHDDKSENKKEEHSKKKR
ncbi:hypothetical protein [Staphylococcus pettenkoferi]|nr:hypothetical protein [Staphylococcus pettenkoferi]